MPSVPLRRAAPAAPAAARVPAGPCPTRADRPLTRPPALPLVLLATLLVTLVATLLGPAAPPAAASPAPSGTDGPSASPPRLPPPATPTIEQVCAGSSRESPVVVDVQTLLPRALRSPDEPLQVAGRLVNCGTESLDALQVRLVVGRRLSTRSELRLAADEPVVGTRRLRGQDATSTVLAPRASTGFDLRVTVADLRLDARNGVYPVAVQARARTGGTRRSPVGLASTFVPWFPEGPAAPTRLAWVAPLVDQPRSGPGAVMVDDGLEDLLSDEPAASGRLLRALLGPWTGARGACTDDPTTCEGDPVPVTWAVDPDLVAGVEAMTRPYAVSRDGRRVDRPRSVDASRWLDTLRTAVGAGDLLALPYGDPDVVALSRTDSPLKDDVALLQRLGRSEAERLLDRAPLEQVAWPPTGPVTGLVDTLAAGRGTALLLDPSVVAPDPAQERTPDPRRQLPSTLEPVTALVPDDVLSRLAQPDPSDDGWQGERLAEQRWIAEAAMIAAERPGQARTLVVALDRRADLLPRLVSEVLADTGRLPWLCGVRLAEVAAGTESCAAQPDPRSPPPATDAVALRTTVPDARVLPPSYVQEVAAVRRASDQFTDQVLMADSDAAKDAKARLLRARGRTLSTAWRTAPAGGQRLLSMLEADVDALRGRVSLVGGPVLLTGRTGTIRLNVQNGLDQPVNVGVRLDPTSAVRLTSEDTALQVLPGRSSQQVSVQVEARTSGRFTARAGLVDASGRPFGGTVELEVRSTQYGRVALAVTAVAAAVLFLAAGARVVRRARADPSEQLAEPRDPARPGAGV